MECGTENVRALALSVLNKCLHGEQYSNLALDATLKRSALSPADRALLTALVYGTIERLLTLDYAISSLSSRRLSELEPEALNLLRMGIYQLCYMDRIPDHAAVNETVALAPRRARGFVNAILRSLLRSGKQLSYPCAATDPISYLSVRYSFHPEICRRFVEGYGMERAESILSSFCTTPPLTLRVNALRTDRERLAARFAASGAEAVPTMLSPDGLRLAGGSPTALPGFSEGEFFVQDEASQLCVQALGARAGMNVLDACSCPGSKAFGAAITMQNSGRIVACDLHRSKLSLITSGAERLGISIIETRERDARALDEAWIESFDRVLCDVPCSGFGVFAKKPELRYKDPAVSDPLPDIQLAILGTSARYVKRGGRLVYSTCTLLPRENGQNVERFLAEHPEFFCLQSRTLFPDADKTDGFFFAVLERR